MSEETLAMALATTIIPGLVGAAVSGLGWLTSWFLSREANKERDGRIKQLERQQINTQRFDSLRFQSLLDSWKKVVALRWDVYALEGDQAAAKSRVLGAELEAMQVLFCEDENEAFNRIRKQLHLIAACRQTIGRNPAASLVEAKRGQIDEMEAEMEKTFPELSKVVTRGLKRLETIHSSES